MSDDTRLVLSRSGYEHRLRAVRHEMATRRIDVLLVDGTVFHMYTGARGMAFSETVLVTEGGAERLTRLERRLFAR